MIQIPLQPVPSQILKIVLSGQNVQLAVYQKNEGIFVDVNSNGTDFVIAVLSHNGVPLVCREYLGFSGNIMFVDLEGESDPYYEGLGTRYQLIYMDAAEYGY